MRVVFAPDWRNGVPYQRLLADALAAEGVGVRFLTGYKRVLPLTRLLRAQPCDLLHLHWPEAYYTPASPAHHWFRRARFRADLALATRRTPFVLTAHNLHEHNLQHHPFARANYAAAYRRARLVLAHTAAARDALVSAYGLPAEKFRVIPHGDLSVVMPPPLPREEARAQLGLAPGPLALIFGAVEPYKGQEEILAWWKAARPSAQLAIVGKPHTDDYRATITSAAEGIAGVTLRFGWLSDADLATWLSAADCVLFNYRTIFTSGAACLARSRGVPIVIPARLETVDLDEPCPTVFRFDHPGGDLAEKLAAALSTRSDYDAAAGWREKTSWPAVARLTAAAYRDALGA
jgi:glycosyltransferase involved in cell wall biosynthesis